MNNKVVTLGLGGFNLPVGTRQEVRMVGVLIAIGVLVWLVWGRVAIKDQKANAEALVRVKSHTIHITDENGPREATIVWLTQRYDFEKKTLQIGGLVATFEEARAGPGHWSARKVEGGRYLVTGMARGHTFEFETDLIYVNPVNDAAQQLFDLEGAKFDPSYPF
ncbi:hypothetical protein HY373_02055 [Candidatus Berkelbacteria bacterium]|nr:hypothetical protein [Candidatus Berkelbacteria bacterium]